MAQHQRKYRTYDRPIQSQRYLTAPAK